MICSADIVKKAVHYKGPSSNLIQNKNYNNTNI